MKIHLLVRHRDETVSHCYSEQAVVSPSSSSKFFCFLIGTKPFTESLTALFVMKF